MKLFLMLIYQPGHRKKTPNFPPRAPQCPCLLIRKEDACLLSTYSMLALC